MLRPQESQNHRATPSAPWDTRRTADEAPDDSIFELSLRVFLSVCGFFHLCLYWAFCLFVCLFGQSYLEAGSCPSSLCVKWLPRNPVCSALLQTLWPDARPEVPVGTSAGLAHKICSSGSRKTRRGVRKG